MASEDVIELGSSDEDDEALPRRPPAGAANKAKQGTKANAMVHIPQNIHGLTIKPAKPLSKPSVRPGNTRTFLPTVSTGRLITTGNLNNQTTIKPVASNKRNSLGMTPGACHANSKPFTIPTISTANLNPMSLMKNLNKSQVVINRVSAPSSAKIAIVKTQPKMKQKPTPRLNPNPMARLPPSVTITKTSRPIKQTPIITNIASLAKKPKGNNVMVPIQMPIKPTSIPMKPKPSPKPVMIKVMNKVKKPKTLTVNPLCQANILTVELDDETDSPSSSTANNPSWYLRPEDHTNKDAEEMEKLNNTEPEPPKFIEICIEDSPVSKPKNRRESELGDAITIDDSPKHSTPKKRTRDSESDDEQGRRKTPKKKKRKKLDYHTEVPLLDNSIEIEIDPIQVDQNGAAVDTIGQVEDDPIAIPEKMDTNEEPAIESKKTDNTADEIVRDDSDKNNLPKATVPTVIDSVAPTKSVAKAVEDIVIEILESPVKKKKGPHSRKKPHSKPKKLERIPEAEPVEVVDSEEFHPMYQKFINICLELDPSSDMKTIVDKKIKGYYKQVPKEYTYSEDFIEMVSSKILSMKAGKEKMYLYIKDVVDELNVQRKLAKNQLFQKETERKESGKLEFTDDSEFDLKRQRQIRKLEKTIRKLHRAIQKLEEQEVDFDDEEDSVYLLTERYKERMVRVHAKLCQLTNTKLPSEPRLHIESRPGQPTGPAKRLEKWINQKVPMGKPLPFPDFHDVLRMVREANNEDKLGWNEADIMEEARDLFTRCGKKLQRRRQEVEWRIAASRLPVDIDPAEASDDLKNKLEHNRLLASKKEIDVFNKYADRQSEMRLEAEEINDKEAEESPVESEDDDAVEEVALSDKEKRKERIKRLIQEKSHKKKKGKENAQSIDEEGNENSQSVEEVEIDDASTLRKANVQLDPEVDPSVITINIQMEEPMSEVLGDSKTAHGSNVTEIENDKNYDAADKEKETKDIDKDPTDKEKDTADKEEEPTDKEKHTKDKEKVPTDKDKYTTDKEKKSKDKEEDPKDKEKEPTSEIKKDVTEKSDANTKSPDKTTKSDADSKSQKSTEKTATDTKSQHKSEKSETDEEIEINSVSDGSEVDELNLLKKLYSETDNSSSESDSDSPIDISDTNESDDAKQNNKVISIENSSESDTRDSNGKNNTNVKYSSITIFPQVDVIEEIESSNDAMESLKCHEDDRNSENGSDNMMDQEKSSENTVEDSNDVCDINITQPENTVKDSYNICDITHPVEDSNDICHKTHPENTVEDVCDIIHPENIVEDSNVVCESKIDDGNSTNSISVPITAPQDDMIHEKNKYVEEILEKPKSVHDEESLLFAIDSLQNILPDSDNPTNNDEGNETSDSEIQSGSQKSLISIGKTIVQGEIVHERECENDMSVDDVTDKDIHFDIERINYKETVNKSDEQNKKVSEDIAVPIPEALEYKDTNKNKTDQSEQPTIDQAEKDSSEKDESMSNKDKTIETTVLISTQDVTNTDVEEKINNAEVSNNTSEREINVSNHREQDLGENLVEKGENLVEMRENLVEMRENLVEMEVDL